jgi:hypothetical protein
MLTQRAVVPYLLQRKLISEQAIVEGDLVVLDASRRNLNFQVISERGPSYLLKQGVEPDGMETVSREATIYQRLHSSIGNYWLDRNLPHFFGYDPSSSSISGMLKTCENTMIAGAAFRLLWP